MGVDESVRIRNSLLARSGVKGATSQGVELLRVVLAVVKVVDADLVDVDVVVHHGLLAPSLLLPWVRLSCYSLGVAYEIPKGYSLLLLSKL